MRKNSTPQKIVIERIIMISSHVYSLFKSIIAKGRVIIDGDQLTFVGLKIKKVKTNCGQKHGLSENIAQLLSQVWTIKGEEVVQGMRCLIARARYNHLRIDIMVPIPIHTVM